MKILVFGASGYIAASLLPSLRSDHNFNITTVSTKLGSGLDGMPNVNVSMGDFDLNLASEYDCVINLASAGVAHKSEDDVYAINENINIASVVSRIASHTSKRLLLHFGSDTEEIFLSSGLNALQGEVVSLSSFQINTSIYSLSKIVQSSLLRYYSNHLNLRIHVIMTPNIYGGSNPSSSLVGQMEDALRNNLPFSLRNPSEQKRFVAIDPFCKYVHAVLADLFDRYAFEDRLPRFEVSSMDFVPKCTVEEFARRQWAKMGGQANELFA